jgi:diguanylate cyclase (GGDEF)-like protein
VLIVENDAANRTLLTRHVEQMGRRVLVGDSCAVRPVAHQGHEVAVTVSIGAAVRDVSMENPEQLLKVADQAVYAAKQSGRNRVVVALAG